MVTRVGRTLQGAQVTHKRSHIYAVLQSAAGLVPRSLNPKPPLDGRVHGVAKVVKARAESYRSPSSFLHRNQKDG